MELRYFQPALVSFHGTHSSRWLHSIGPALSTASAPWIKFTNPIFIHMILIVLILILLAILGMPLFAVLGAGGLVASHNADVSPVSLIIELYRLASQGSLVAIPLFTLAGMIMAAGGAPQRLIKLFDALLGWMPGDRKSVV